jgi:hypothetical protein
MVTSALLREVSVEAQDKITEMEMGGSLSPKVAEAMRKTLRIVDVGTSIIVSAVGGSIAAPVADGKGIPEAVRDAVQNLAATAQTYVDKQDAMGIKGLSENADYIVRGEQDR